MTSIVSPSSPPHHHLLHRVTIFSIVSPSSPSCHHLLHRVTIFSIVSPSSPSCHHLLHRVAIFSIVSPSSPSCRHLLHRVAIFSIVSPSSSPSCHHLLLHRVTIFFSIVSPSSSPSCHHLLLHRVTIFFSIVSPSSSPSCHHLLLHRVTIFFSIVSPSSSPSCHHLLLHRVTIFFSIVSPSSSPSCHHLLLHRVTIFFSIVSPSSSPSCHHLLLHRVTIFFSIVSPSSSPSCHHLLHRVTIFSIVSPSKSRTMVREARTTQVVVASPRQSEGEEDEEVSLLDPTDSFSDPEQAEAAVTTVSTLDRATAEETTGPPLSEAMAQWVGHIIKTELQPEKLKLRLDRELCPGNAPSISAKKVNPSLFNKRGGPMAAIRGHDLQLQSIQKVMMKAMLPLVRLADSFLLAESDSAVMPAPTDALHACLSSFSLLATANLQMDQLRRDGFKAALPPKYKGLFCLGISH